MDEAKRKYLEAKGYRIGDAADFLEMTPEERQLLDLRVKLSKAIRERRKALKATQGEVAKLMGSSQSRMALAEAAEPGVSLDLMFRGFFALGGTLSELDPQPAAEATKASRARSTQKNRPPKRAASARKVSVGAKRGNTGKATAGK